MANHALCVGINDYPGTRLDLRGCVNDATDWQSALADGGYSPVLLTDASATRDAVMDALRTLIGNAVSGDSCVFTFSGHGSWLPDESGDESDERDELLCPYDVMQHAYILDDDLYQVFSTKASGVRITMVSDSCHSGTVVRAAPKLERPATDAAGARLLPPYVLAQGDRRLERAIDRAVRKPATTKLRYPALLLAACADDELSYDASFDGRPNGAFTRTALTALATGVTTPQALYDEIRKTLPTEWFPQTPQIHGSRAARNGPLF